MSFLLQMTVQDFDQKAGAVEALLREKLKVEQELGNEEGVPALEGDIWSTLAKIDSKTAFKALSATNEFFGTKIPPSLIKKGGYETEDEMVSDLIGKLRASCGTSMPAASNQ